MATEKKLAAARKVFNSLRDTDRRYFEKAVFEYADQLESEGFEVKGIDFRIDNKEATVWGRYGDEEYKRGDNDSWTLFETCNRYTKYLGIDNWRNYKHR